MSTAEERAAAREAELAEAVSKSRRLAAPEDYVWDKAQEKYWDLRDGTLHNPPAVNGSIPRDLWRIEIQEGNNGNVRERMIKPSDDIVRIEFDQTVEGSTWWPGKPQIIKDVFIDANGHRPAPGRRIYNQYIPPPEPELVQGYESAERWIEHVKALWPEETEHFFDYCAHMLQRPEQKATGAVVLSGAQGIGKDAALLPIKAAVGSWNHKGIDPDELFSSYQPWRETLMLVVDEVRPSKDEFHSTSMYNILKPLLATPPETLPLNNKYMALRYVINVMRVFITTNNWMAMYIPAEDRRMYIMHSEQQQHWASAEYFNELFGWFEAGGNQAVAHWLWHRDISSFNPKAEVIKTEGWKAIANSWGEPEDGVDQALEQLGRPEVVFGFELAECSFDGAEDIRHMLKSPRRIGNRMLASSYVSMAPSTGRWYHNGQKRRVQARLAFVRQDLKAKLGVDEVVKIVRERMKRLADEGPICAIPQPIEEEEF